MNGDNPTASKGMRECWENILRLLNYYLFWYQMWVMIPKAVTYRSLTTIAAPSLNISGWRSNRQIKVPFSPTLSSSLVKLSMIWTCCPIFPICINTERPGLRYVWESITIKLASKFHIPFFGLARLSIRTSPVLLYFTNLRTVAASCSILYFLRGSSNKLTSYPATTRSVFRSSSLISLIIKGRY